MIVVIKLTVFWTLGHVLGSLDLKDNHILWSPLYRNSGKIQKGKNYVKGGLCMFCGEGNTSCEG